MGLMLSVWRKRASAVLRVVRGLIGRGWTKLTWVGQMGVIAYALFTAGSLVARASATVMPVRIAGEVAAWVGTCGWVGAFVIIAVIGLWRSRALARELGRLMSWLLLALAAGIVAWFLPVIMAALETSGGVRVNAIYKATGGGTLAFRDWWLWDLEFWGPWVIVAFVVVIPQLLHKELRWHPEFVLPAWLAGFAAVATWLVAFLLYFNGLRPPGGAVGLAVGATFAAALLAPFYRLLAVSCWKGGVAHVIDPRDWWSAWGKAYQEVRLAFPSPAVTAKSTQTPDPQVKFLQMLTGLDLSPFGNLHH